VPALRERGFAYVAKDVPVVKDAIGAIGVPAAELDLVLVSRRPWGQASQPRGCKWSK